MYSAESPPVVSDTDIFVSSLENGFQVTVFRETIVCEGPTTKIVPYPCMSGFAAEILDVSAYPEFLEDLRAKNEVIMMDKDEMKKYHRPIPRGAVKGNYIITVVKTLDDLLKLAWDKYPLTEKIRGILTDKYGKGYGFLICQTEASIKQAMVSYRHKAFKSNVFVPCLGEGRNEKWGWDHTIFIYGQVVEKQTRLKSAFRETFLVTDLSPIRKKLRLPLIGRGLSRITIPPKEPAEGMDLRIRWEQQEPPAKKRRVEE